MKLIMQCLINGLPTDENIMKYVIQADLLNLTNLFKQVTQDDM